jgi:hypothetical protein
MKHLTWLLVQENDSRRYDCDNRIMYFLGDDELLDHKGSR